MIKVWYLVKFLKIYKKVSEYDQEILQSHTADQPMASRERAAEQNPLDPSLLSSITTGNSMGM